jgi:large subunit ribosomal protein L35
VPKMKTNKSIKSRFKVTGTGKLKRTKPGRRHILTKKSSKRKRRLRKSALVSDGLKKTYIKMLGRV